MLADIARVALTIGRDLFPDTPFTDTDTDFLAIGTAGVSVLDVSPRERVAYLRTVWTHIENALRRIEATPDTVLQPERRSVPLEKSRRATPKYIAFALTRAVPNRGGTRHVLEQGFTLSPDTPANRLIKGMLVTLLRDMTAAAELAAVVGACSVEGDALWLRDRLRRTLRRAPWRTLPLPAGTQLPALPQSVRQSGPYRLLYDTFRHYRQGFSFDWKNPVFRLPAREMWLLYEYWCLFQTAKALRDIGFRTIAADDFFLSRAGLTFTLIRGRASSLTFLHPTGQRVKVTYNRNFPPPAELRRDGWYSRSHTMRPDIVLETANRLLVLDAKFKTYAETRTVEEEENLPLTADINQCHAYRDGILHRGHPGVFAAWLLYPGRVTGGNRAIVAYCTGDISGLSEVGAILLRPDREAPELRDLLSHFLQTLS